MIEPITHTVKSWTLFFNDILSGERTSDIRYTGDRRYHVGDFLNLREFDPVKQEYSGRSALAKITYIQQNKSNPCAISDKALANEYAVLSIKLVSQSLKVDTYTPTFKAGQLSGGIINVSGMETDFRAEGQGF